ncbi:MmgE/PrpD family protein [Oceanibacterium hippocampi]|uniref:MmgE/PrpD family protein n=1 Tax=Oceanibacterium hippocampi TaxID=745714 RepID=A0A1Y5TH90_9PROT|nr:MmgE/PrpD family protein [Oceanibacterium hippocampi]SLN64004.1 MmgE/PrpD family protein [Oceanibacterium hippocampi]
MDEARPGNDVDANARLAAFTALDDLSGLTPAGWETATRQIADTVAVGWAGSAADGVAEATELVLAEGGRPAARIWGRGERVSAAQAAFVNGVAAAALDFDSVHQSSLLHPAAITVPIALALGADIGASGERIVQAHIVGSEVMSRVSLATPRRSNWFTPSIYGIFGATATAARLLGLSAEQTHNAFGLALAQTSGTKQAIFEPALAKRFQTAFAIRAGLLAAQLAERGVTGARRYLDGAAGLFALYEEGSPTAVVEGIGTAFVFDQAVIKKYPACLCTHVVIDAARRLKEQHRIDLDDTASIGITVTDYMHRLIGGPYDPGRDPQVAAQFSAAYAAVCALDGGGMTLADIEPGKAAAAERVRRAQAIEVGIFDDLKGHVAPATVSITLKGGENFSLHVADVPNAAFGDDADAALRLKALDCLGRGHQPLGTAAAENCLQQLLGLRDGHASALFDDAVS